MKHRITIGVCLAVAIAATSYVSVAASARRAAFVAVTQTAVYGVAVLGGYLGFACVEARRLQHRNPGEVRGKLAVAGLFAIGVAVVAGFAASM